MILLKTKRLEVGCLKLKGNPPLVMPLFHPTRVQIEGYASFWVRFFSVWRCMFYLQTKQK